MLNEIYIEKLLKLIELNFISLNDIKDEKYRLEVERRLAMSQ